ncbi:Cysteine-rich secretory protein family protein [Gemmata sp. SH-PL17]|uniref:CAP domain-containing protein n=1 Tax=Gemmata sp. SH-PL17 TaxID=1630693 RepID=UPI00078E142D|nr:CAP domain-containing protein [Gemmata sp. SH-PL17]AMV29689.1 Cysteine-rich secretory protein family protein [Gemmata sp. SH-PL17]
MNRLACLLFAITPSFFSGAPADDKKDAPREDLKLTADEQAVVDLTNAERKKADLQPLKPNPQLMEAARGHAQNMAKQDKLEHVLDDKTPADRTKAAGYKSGTIGENIAWNQKSAKDVVAGWMDSEMHRDNILKKDYTEIGVAVAKNEKGEPYWVQVFGKP